MLVVKCKAKAGIKLSIGEKNIYIKNMDEYTTRFGINADKEVLVERIEAENEHISGDKRKDELQDNLGNR